MLWLALHFPCLPLEALPLRQSPSAVVARGRIVVCDTAAQLAGVAAGQKLSTALGLLPALRVFERDPAREAAALDALACWAGSLTPAVSLRPPNGLLLEIGGCLRLFGGVAVIVDKALAGCAEQAWRVVWAVAPTPLGAWWLALAGGGQVATDLPMLDSLLAGLDCSVPPWPGEVAARLESYGLRRLGEVMQQPAAGLRQRLGNGPVDDLLRARGEIHDPQPPFVFPERFSLALELPSRVEHAEGLAFAGQRLAVALCGWLQARALLVRACTLQMGHDDGTQSALVLRFGEPCRDEARFLRLLREHLARLTLTAPVELLCLRADETVALGGTSASLFAAAVAGEGAAACLERLRARLGEAAVQVLASVAEHRPECASRGQVPDFGQKSRFTADVTPREVLPARPLWLLPQPQPLAEHADGPHWHGPLQLLTRGERIESGWWDSGELASGETGREVGGEAHHEKPPEACRDSRAAGAGEQSAVGDIRRDYFIARNRHGQQAWIFRDASGWFLHGLFA